MAGFVITDDDAFPDGMEYGRGLDPRNYSIHPVGYCSKPFLLDLIPSGSVEKFIRAKETSRGRLSDFRNRGNGGSPISSTNQGNTNYCWAHSSTAAVMLARTVAGEPHVDLSATSIACKIKNFKNVGGWGSQSLEYITDHGVCRLDDWPQGPAGIRRDMDSPPAWVEAKRFRVTEWMDLEPRNTEQLIACLLRNFPVVSDFNWWRHSVVTLDLISLNPLRTLIWNSWGDRWGDNGFGILEGRKAIPDGMIAPFVTVGG